MRLMPKSNVKKMGMTITANTAEMAQPLNLIEETRILVQ
jgi:hypothetical protein